MVSKANNRFHCLHCFYTKNPGSSAIALCSHAEFVKSRTYIGNQPRRLSAVSASSVPDTCTQVLNTTTNSPQVLRSSLPQPTTMLKVFGYEHGMREGAWTRKGPGHKSGSSAVPAPSHKRSVKGGLRTSQADVENQAYYSDDEDAATLVSRRSQLPPAYNQQEQACYSKRQVARQQQGAYYNNHPSHNQLEELDYYDQPVQNRNSAHKSAYPNRRNTAPYPDDLEEGMYPEQSNAQVNLRRSGSHASNHGPPLQLLERSHHSSRRSESSRSHHADAAPESAHTVHYSNHEPRASRSHSHRSQNHPVHRSEHGSQRLAPIYEGSSNHAPRLTLAEVLSHKRGEAPVGRREHRSRDVAIVQGGRQYTVHNDFAEEPQGSRGLVLHTGSAKGKPKQKAKLFMGKKEVTLAAF